MVVRYTPSPELEIPNLNLMGAFAQGQALSQNALQQQRLEQQMQLANLAAGYTANKDLREAEKLQAEQRVKDFELASKKYDYLVNMAPRLNERNYGAWYKQVSETFPLAAATLPPQYDPEAVKMIALQGADLKPQVLQQQFGDTTRLLRVGPTGGAEVVPGSTATAPTQYEPIKGQGDTIIGYKSKYGAQVLSPEEFEAQSTRDYIGQREGTGKNPRSSAQGPGQFVDDTFVETFRKTFPDRAKGMSRENILAQRGTGVEEPMLQTFTANNQERLRNAGFEPTKGNTYLAHFAGADGALDVLRASPDTPITELLSPKAIKANPEVFSKVKTAGDLIRWAGGGEAGGMQPAKMKPLGTPARAAQDAALNILGDLGFDESGEDRVSKLIKSSTSGPVDVALGEIPRLFGKSPPGRQDIAQLEVLANEYSLEKLGNKLGGNVSDADVKFIAKTMGDIANPMIPADERLKAWGEVKRRLARYADVKLPTGKTVEAAPSRGTAGETPTTTARNVKRRGTYNGRAVVEYDDGTVEYAN